MRILKRILTPIFVSCILSVLGTGPLCAESGIYDRIGIIAEHGMPSRDAPCAGCRRAIRRAGRRPEERPFSL